RPLRALALRAARLRAARVQHLHVHFAAGAALDGLRLARLLGIPWSVTAHAYDIFVSPANLREKLEAAAFATTGCDYNVRELRRVAPTALIERVVMGVDPERFRRTRPYPGGRHVVGVGRLVEKKGFGDLVAALALVPDAQLTLVGEGPLRGALEAAAREAGVAARVTFAGRRSPAEIRALLESADALAMPCVVAADGDRDSMPVVVKEALAMEVPVVATDEVGLPELVRPEFGRLAPPGDPAALAAALREPLDQPADERAAMGRAGREHVKRECDVRRESARVSALIDTAVSR
ncbi:MAG: hypothetical protein QOJ07_3109, partial [Thermoleophilaceae bacterium]|nr:hypothetical protein [Thermoleophilaceae bacterium]